MAVFSTRPALRWAVPVVVLMVALGVGAGQMLAADASPTLPPRTAAQLLVDLQTAKVDAFSGTVVQKADLGLPQLPNLGGQGSSDLASLVSGTHTLRVWYAGPDRQRLALLGTLGESDVIHNGRDVWTWSSRDNAATHRVLAREFAAKRAPEDLASVLPLTPQQAAAQALAAIDPTTKVSTEGTARVAGRSAYELVLVPRDTWSRVAQVRLAVDASERIPLRVRVYARGAAEPVYEIGFTRISFAVPSDAHFRFTPPPGAKVEQIAPGQPGRPSKEELRRKAELLDKAVPPSKAEAPSEARLRKGEPPAGGNAASGEPQLVGEGWAAVLVATDAPQGGLPGQLGAVLETLPRVSGSWGSGRLLESKLLSVLVTDDGRMLAGAVDPERLYEVAAEVAGR